MLHFAVSSYLCVKNILKNVQYRLIDTKSCKYLTEISCLGRRHFPFWPDMPPFFFNQISMKRHIFMGAGKAAGCPFYKIRQSAEKGHRNHLFFSHFFFFTFSPMCHILTVKVPLFRHTLHSQERNGASCASSPITLATTLRPPAQALCRSPHQRWMGVSAITANLPTMAASVPLAAAALLAQQAAREEPMTSRCPAPIRRCPWFTPPLKAGATCTSHSRLCSRAPCSAAWISRF